MACHARNRMPHAGLEGKSPYQVLRDRQPGRKHLKPFMCPCWVKDPKYTDKAHAQRVPANVLYYSDWSSSWVVKTDDGRILESRDVAFGENREGNQDPDEYDDDEELFVHNPYFPEAANTAEVEEESANFASYAEISNPESLETMPQAMITEAVPWSKAMKGEDRQKWLDAVESERKSFVEKGVYEEVPYREDVEKVRLRLILNKKTEASGERYKARAVCLGNHQDKSESLFSPVVRWATARVVMILCHALGYSILQTDISTAYLNADIDKEVFVMPPTMWKNGNTMWKLRKAVYGLRQSAALWNREIDRFMTEDLKFNRSWADGALYFRSDGTVALLYVDDLLIFTRNAAKRDEMYQRISEKYAAKQLFADKDGFHEFLGVSFNWGTESLTFKQTKLCDKVLETFNPSGVDMRPAPTPIIENDMRADDDETGTDIETSLTVNRANYRSFIGSLMYLAVSTRWDLCFAVAYLSRFLENPSRKHFRMCKRVLRYLAGTRNFELVYKKKRVNLLECWTDSNWDSPSTSGALVKLGGCPVHWHSKKQISTPLSSTEAEYVAASEAGKEVAYIRNLLEEKVFNDIISPVLVDCPTPMRFDNLGAKYTAETRENKRCKHVKLRWHYIRELIENGEIAAEYVPTQKQQADIFTKAVTEKIFVTISDLIKELQ